MISTTDLESPGTMANTPNGNENRGGYTKTPHPCDACKRSKLKCDQRRPTCETCQKRRKTVSHTSFPLPTFLSVKKEYGKVLTSDSVITLRLMNIRMDESGSFTDDLEMGVHIVKPEE